MVDETSWRPRKGERSQVRISSACGEKGVVTLVTCNRGEARSTRQSSRARREDRARGDGRGSRRRCR